MGRCASHGTYSVINGRWYNSADDVIFIVDLAGSLSRMDEKNERAFGEMSEEFNVSTENINSQPVSTIFFAPLTRWCSLSQFKYTLMSWRITCCRVNLSSSLAFDAVYLPYSMDDTQTCDTWRRSIWNGNLIPLRLREHSTCKFRNGSRRIFLSTECQIESNRIVILSVCSSLELVYSKPFRLNQKSPLWTVVSNCWKKISNVQKSVWHQLRPNCQKHHQLLMSQNGKCLRRRCFLLLSWVRRV